MYKENFTPIDTAKCILKDLNTLYAEEHLANVRFLVSEKVISIDRTNKNYLIKIEKLENYISNNGKTVAEISLEISLNSVKLAEESSKKSTLSNSIALISLVISLLSFVLTLLSMINNN
ncbi:MAG: hypothetical protein ACRC51_00620 [Cetobacterium sp.]